MLKYMKCSCDGQINNLRGFTSKASKSLSILDLNDGRLRRLLFVARHREHVEIVTLKSRLNC